MALKLVCFLVLAIAETVWALEWVLHLVAQLMCYKFFLSPEFLAANRTRQGTVSHTFLEISQVLRYVWSNRYFIPVEPNPFVKFRESHILRRFLFMWGSVIKTVDIVESAWNLNLNLVGTFCADRLVRNSGGFWAAPMPRAAWLSSDSIFGGPLLLCLWTNKLTLLSPTDNLGHRVSLHHWHNLIRILGRQKKRLSLIHLRLKLNLILNLWLGSIKWYHHLILHHLWNDLDDVLGVSVNYLNRDRRVLHEVDSWLGGDKLVAVMHYLEVRSRTRYLVHLWTLRIFGSQVNLLLIGEGGRALWGKGLVDRDRVLLQWKCVVMCTLHCCVFLWCHVLFYHWICTLIWCWMYDAWVTTFNYCHKIKFFNLKMINWGSKKSAPYKPLEIKM